MSRIVYAIPKHFIPRILPCNCGKSRVSYSWDDDFSHHYTIMCRECIRRQRTFILPSYDGFLTVIGLWNTRLTRISLYVGRYA